MLTEWRGASQAPGLERRLNRVGAETAALAGVNSCLLADVGQAHAYWTYAGDLARDAGDSPTEAYSLALRSGLYSTTTSGGVGGNTARAMDLLNRAVVLAGPGKPLVLSCILARRAEQYAVIGDVQACEHDLEAAERILSFHRPKDDTLVVPRTYDELAAIRGNCAVLLRQPQQAVSTLEGVLQVMPEWRIAFRGTVRADLAAAYAQRGEVEQACATLQDVLTATAAERAAHNVYRVAGIRSKYLSAWQHSPAVKQLDEQLHVFL
jgi:tetratricopeptide (TPR) repeat protein